MRRSGSGARFRTRPAARSSSIQSCPRTATSCCVRTPTAGTAHPDGCRLQGAYYAEAGAPERLSARSAQIGLAGRSQELPAFVLRRVGKIEGRVVDRQGKPVSGAIVRQSGDGPLPTETLSDDQGEFRLTGVLEGPAFVFAEGKGFRFHFQGIDANAKPVTVVLARTSEPPASSYRTLPPVLPIDEEKALARRLMQAHGERVLKCGDDDDKFRFLINEAAIDPFAVLERIETVKFNEPDYAKAARLNLVEALAARIWTRRRPWSRPFPTQIRASGATWPSARPATI